VQENEFYTVMLEPTDYKLQEVVVEAFNRIETPVDVPGSLTLIPTEQIERESPVTVVPLAEPGTGSFCPFRST
jgi:hypothetical protein